MTHSNLERELEKRGWGASLISLGINFHASALPKDSKFEGNRLWHSCEPSSGNKVMTIMVVAFAFKIQVKE